MVERPEFKSHFHIEVVEGDGVFLLSEKTLAVLRGRLYELVAPWVDGVRSADDIAELLKEDASPAEVYYALGQLEKLGYVRESEPSIPADEAVFWDLQGVSPVTARNRLAHTIVSVTGFGVDVEPFVRILQTMGVRVGDQGQIGVVLTDDYLRNSLESYNHQSLQLRRDWLLFRPLGAEILVGPLFRPGTTGCWRCLAQRVRDHRQVETYVHTKKERPDPFRIARCTTAATQNVALNIGALQVVNWICARTLPALENRLLSFDLLSCTPNTHVLVRRPQCSACGDGAYLDRSPQPLFFQTSAESPANQFSTSHFTDAEQAWNRLAHHISPITGIVQAVQHSSPPTDAPLHVYVATHSFGTHAENLHDVVRRLHVTSTGKGTSEVEAKVGALCEALERYSGDFRGEEVRERATFQELGDRAIHPNQCMLFSDKQLSGHHARGLFPSAWDFLPLRFDENARIEWSPVWSMTHRVFKYLPTAFCYYNYPLQSELAFCVGCSNGNAAGRNLQDATLRGCLELVERDCVALWWYNRLRMPGVDLDSFFDYDVGAIQRIFRTRGADLWVLDLMSDLEIPAFAALSRRLGDGGEHILMGFGAHLDARTAILHAILELNQMHHVAPMLLATYPNPQGSDANDMPEIVKWLRMATLKNHGYLLPDNRVPLKMASDYHNCGQVDTMASLSACQARIEQAGMEMLVLDQTRGDIKLPVVKVIVPGLRHFWPRFAPGRLYDVPVRLGHLPRQLMEDQLNPTPMFL